MAWLPLSAPPSAVSPHFALMVAAVAAGRGGAEAEAARNADEAEVGRTADATGSRPVRSSWRLAWQEFLVAATNPKALILFTVFLPQFLPRGAEGVAVPLLARRARRLLDGLTGVAMLGLAAWLATEQH
ncbi:hypothetical protein [Streptomyces sp. NPDC127108]|uniref:hypothetical protein n=1 Tax=Streptomyces sp. NPDC127108 TaxID=3345361 RepID=UPI0036411FCE